MAGYLTDCPAGDEEMTEQCSIYGLIGPDGLLIADTFQVGLMLVAQTVFPAQYHDATESLFVLSGSWHINSLAIKAFT